MPVQLVQQHSNWIRKGYTEHKNVALLVSDFILPLKSKENWLSWIRCWTRLAVDPQKEWRGLLRNSASAIPSRTRFLPWTCNLPCLTSWMTIHWPLHPDWCVKGITKLYSANFFFFKCILYNCTCITVSLCLFSPQILEHPCLTSVLQPEQ